MTSQAPGREAMQAAVDMFNQRRYGEAETLLLRLAQNYPMHGFSWKVLGPVLNLQGRYAEALSAMQKAVELMPRDAECHRQMLSLVWPGVCITCRGNQGQLM